MRTVSIRGIGRSRAAGYTLMELIVVLAILSIMAAVMVPIYQGSLSWVRGDQAVKGFLGTMKFAQERAVMEGYEYRVYIDPDQRIWWLMHQTGNDDKKRAYQDVERPFGGQRAFPDGVEIDIRSARRDRERDARYIAFYPSGACDSASLRLEMPDGGKVRIDTKGRLGRFEVKES